MAEAGWYTDPQDSWRLRYWDGDDWTEHTQDRPTEVEPVGSTIAWADSKAETPPGQAESDETDTRPQPASTGAEPAPAAEPPPPAPVATPEPPAPAPPPPAPVATPEPPAPPPTPSPPSSGPTVTFARPLPPNPQLPKPQPPAPQPTYTASPPPPGQPPSYAEPAPPPTPPAPSPPAEPAVTVAQPGHLSDVGAWLGQTLRVGLSKLVPCGVLAVLGLVPSVFFYAVFFLALSDAANSPGSGVGGGAIAFFVLAAVLFVAWMLWAGVIALAQNHLLHEAHLGRPTAIGDSMQAGFRGIGRLVWAYLTLVAYLIVIAVVVGGLTFVFGLVSDTLATAFFVIAYIGVLILSIWLGVKLLFLLIAAAVAPAGQSVIKASVDTGADHFWLILGRMLLLGVLTTAVLLPVSAIVGVVFGTVGSTFFDDPGAATAGAVAAAVAVGILLYLVAALMIQVFSYSGVTRLYIELGGPTDESEMAGELSLR